MQNAHTRTHNEARAHTRHCTIEITVCLYVVPTISAVDSAKSQHEQRWFSLYPHFHFTFMTHALAVTLAHTLDCGTTHVSRFWLLFVCVVLVVFVVIIGCCDASNDSAVNHKIKCMWLCRQVVSALPLSSYAALSIRTRTYVCLHVN